MLNSTSAIQRTNQARRLCHKAIEELGYVQLDADCPQELHEILKFLEISEQRLAVVVASVR